MDRTRTFSWTDPALHAGAARETTGLEFLRRILAGEIPQAPISECLGFVLAEADDGRVVFELEPGEHQYNPIGSVHGGVLATVLDSAAGAAVHSTLGLGEGYTTLEIKSSFLRPVSVKTGRMRCEGTVLSRGSRVAVSEAKLTDHDGWLLAHATSTCLILTARPP